LPVADELPAGLVGEPPLEAAQRLLGSLALGALALVVAAPVGAWVADLGDGHHVQRVAGPPVPGPRQAVADLVAGGHAGRSGAVVAGEPVPGGEPGDVADFGQDPPRGQRPDPVKAGQRGARLGDQGGDLAGDGLEPGTGGPDVAKVVAGNAQADRGHVTVRPDAGQQRLGLVRGQLAAHPAGRELGKQPVQPADRLGALGRELLAAAAAGGG
jgi:hypothetical protein